MSDPIIGASLTSSGVVAKKTYTDELVIGADRINDISHEYEDASVNSVPSSKALHDGLDRLDQEVKKIDPNNNFYRDNTVITLPLIAMTFDTDSDWEILNWIANEGSVFFVGQTYTLQNFVGIPTEVIPFEGYYFILIDIPRLDSGKIVLYDDGGNVLKTFTEYGKFPVEVHVSNPDIAEFKFVAEGVFPGEVVTINSVLFSRITPRLREYMNYLFSGGSGELTYSEVMQLINQSATNITNTFNNRIVPIEENLDDHLLNMSNPHGVTKEQIGAASISHSHTPASIGAAAVIHGHEAEDCNAAPVVHTHNPNECGAAPVVHTHTPAECGSAAEEHTHSPEECGAAPMTHYHTAVEVGASPSNHTHSQYATESMVTNLVNAAVTEITVGSIRTLEPMTILSAPLGLLPVGFESVNFSKPVGHIKFPYLIHESNSDYDLHDGLVLSNIDALPDHPVQYAFKKHLTNEDYAINVAAFHSTETEMSQKVFVEYRFHQDRTIDKFTIFRDLTNAIGGVPTLFDLYVDNVFIASVIGEDTTSGYTYWAQTNTSLETVLSNPVTGRNFTFVISKVYVDSNSFWGMRVEFSFADADPLTLEYHSEINIASVGSTGTQFKTVTSINPVNLPVDPDIKTPIYVNLNFTETETGFVTHLTTSHLAPEFGESSNGVQLFANTFSGKIHPDFGTLSATSEDPTNVLENIYSTTSNYWKSIDGIVDATISHEFLNSYDFIGYSLKFSNQMFINRHIPDQWILTVTYSDDTTEIANSVSNFFPYKPKDTDKPIIYLSNKLTLLQDIKKLELHLIGNQGQTSLAVQEFIPLFRSNFYHVYKNMIDDPSKFPFGKLRVLESYDHTWKGYKHEGLVTGNNCHIPIDGMRLQPNYPVTHTLVNPFHTKLIDLSVFTYASASALAPKADVIEVTEEVIKVMTYSPGQYSLSIKRKW